MTPRTEPPVVMIDGAVPQAPRVSVFDRGFLYGDGVFEVLRTYAGAPFALEEHLGRLALSARALGIAMPAPISRWIAEVRQVLAARTFDEAVVRLILTRGEGEGVDPPAEARPTRVIIASPLRAPPAALYESGVRVTTVRTPWTAPTPGALHLRGVKSLGYAMSLHARREARSRGFDEAMLVGSDGVVFEAAAANVFTVSQGELRTPPVDDGLLPGVTRDQVLQCARALGVTAREARTVEADLWTADEVFLTSSVRELVPVTWIDDHEVGDGRPGPVTARLLAGYRARV